MLSQSLKASSLPVAVLAVRGRGLGLRQDGRYEQTERLRLSMI